MQALMGMDVDTMVIALPTALVTMYLIIRIQLFLSERKSPVPGLIIPIICFLTASILALRPLLITDLGEFPGLAKFCLRMWLTFNIITIVLSFPYIKARRSIKALSAAMEQDSSVSSEESVSADDFTEDETFS